MSVRDVGERSVSNVVHSWKSCARSDRACSETSSVILERGEPNKLGAGPAPGDSHDVPDPKPLPAMDAGDVIVGATRYGEVGGVAEYAPP